MGYAAWDGGIYCKGVEIYCTMVGDNAGMSDYFWWIDRDTAGVADGYCRGGRGIIHGCCWTLQGCLHFIRLEYYNY